MKLRGLAALLALLCCQTAALAQQTDLTPRSPWLLLGQALLSLAVVIGVIYLVYFGIRRVSDRQFSASAGGPIHVVQTRHLGGDRWLYLVEVEGRRLIIGGADGQVSPIAELEAREEAGPGGRAAS